jgi:hypothetical protein
LLCAKRVWRCPDPGCPRLTFTEEHPLARPRAKLTTPAAKWATGTLQRFDTSVSALAHQLGVSWHTAWDAVRVEAVRRIGATDRLQGVDALGVDEHVWSHTGPPGSSMVTGIVDHTRDTDGIVHARLFRDAPERPTPAGSRNAAPGSPRGSRRQRWIRSAATLTRSAMSCPEPSLSWMRSMS